MLRSPPRRFFVAPRVLHEDTVSHISMRSRAHVLVSSDIGEPEGGRICRIGRMFRNYGRTDKAERFNQTELYRRTAARNVPPQTCSARTDGLIPASVAPEIVNQIRQRRLP